MPCGGVWRTGVATASVLEVQQQQHCSSCAGEFAMVKVVAKVALL